MDLLAKFGRSIRELNFIAETEHSATENLQFTPQLKGTLRRKFLSKKADWLPLEEEGEDEEAAQDRSNETAASAEKINVMTGLQILMDVSNAAMEVVVEQPLNSCYAPDESEGLDCSSLSRNSSPFHGTDRKRSSAGLIPTPLNILEQVGQQKDLLRWVNLLYAVIVFTYDSIAYRFPPRSLQDVAESNHGRFLLPVHRFVPSPTVQHLTTKL